MRTTIVIALLALLSVFALACAEDDTSAKGEESAVPEPSPKADTWFAPTLHGELSFGVESEATIADGELFHAWDFTLSDTATIELKTSPDTNLDTVMYLYHRGAEDDSWGAYVERNDDHDGTIASRIGGSFDAGLYRIMVKGHKDMLRGSFRLSGTCDGDGCPAPTLSEPLTEQQAADVVDALDNICPDTFCGGDLNYYGADVTCDFDKKSCNMIFDAQSYYEDSILPMTALDAVQSANRVVTGEYSDGSGTFVGTLLEMVDKGEDGIWLRASCEMTGAYGSLDDVLDTSGSYSQLSDTFYEQFIDCLSEVEPMMFDL